MESSGVRETMEEMRITAGGQPLKRQRNGVQPVHGEPGFLKRRVPGPCESTPYHTRRQTLTLTHYLHCASSSDTLLLGPKVIHLCLSPHFLTSQPALSPGAPCNCPPAKRVGHLHCLANSCLLWQGGTVLSLLCVTPSEDSFGHTTLL